MLWAFRLSIFNLDGSIPIIMRCSTTARTRMERVGIALLGNFLTLVFRVRKMSSIVIGLPPTTGAPDFLSYRAREVYFLGSRQSVRLTRLLLEGMALS